MAIRAMVCMQQSRTGAIGGSCRMIVLATAEEGMGQDSSGSQTTQKKQHGKPSSSLENLVKDVFYVVYLVLVERPEQLELGNCLLNTGLKTSL
jgi:hypothetical protein